MSTDDPDFWSDVQAAFAAAMEADPSERARIVLERCANRPELRAEVESLLAAHDGDDSFLNVPAVDSGPLDADGLAGKTVGPFRLVERIGAGGMGVVYLADRADGEFAQRVAVKLIDEHVRNADALRRFRAERQILAALSHPHIVTLLDGGVTEDGQPYLAMEYVEGAPITTYCRDRALSIENRLRLFQQVCAAVQYAHQHGVVHRDLKPGNILVTSDGIPKILDFGVAKLLDASGSAPDATATGLVRPLTPNYASPEQLRGLAATTAFDIYALGVLLYELLAEVRPYDAAGKPLDEILRIVVEEEPQRPSAARARTDSRVPDASHPLKGDLDAIVLKAMAKEPARRYSSAQELSDDIARHLSGQPVLAREMSIGYLALKLARRHRAAFGAVAVSVLALLTALGVSLWQTQIAVSERNRAQLETEKARQIAAFLRTLFSSAYPKNRVPGAKLSAQDLVENGAARVDQELGPQPEVQASMLAILGAVYTEMGLYEQALPLVERSLALREKLLGPEHADVAESLYTLGRLKRFLGEFEAAQPYLERAVKIREQPGGPDDLLLAEALAELGNVFWYRGRPEGRVHLERAVAIEERAGGPQLSRWLTALANFDLLTGDLDNAQKLLERALEVGGRAEGRPGFLVSVTILNLGEVLRAQEDYGRARSLLEQALEIAVQLYGAEHQATVYNWAELGELHFAMGDHEKAREFLDRSISVGERILGPDHVGIAAPLTYYGRLLLAEGRAREATPLFERAMRIREKTHGPKHGFVAENLLDLARVAMQVEGPAAGEPLLRRALAIQRETLQPGHRALVPTLTALAESLLARSGQVEARTLLNEAVQIARAKLPAHHSQRAHAEAALALHARR